MLTGDKFETAENVAYSCRLINEKFIFYKIQHVSDVGLICCYKTAEKSDSLKSIGVRRALLVDAATLPTILTNPAFKMYFTQIAKSCEAVICCRVSPGQKAELVRLVMKDDE